MASVLSTTRTTTPQASGVPRGLSLREESKESKLVPAPLVRTKRFVPDDDVDYEIIYPQPEALLSEMKEVKRDYPRLHDPVVSLLPDLVPPLNALEQKVNLQRIMKLASTTSQSKQFKIRLGTSIAVSSNGSGLLNAVIAVSTVAAVTDFSSCAALFGEFFVESMTVKYMPFQRYTAPIGYVNTTLTSTSSLVFSTSALHHGITAPTTIALTAALPSVQYCDTCDPFTFRWKNIEKRTSTLTSPVPSTATATQSWCLTDATSASAYTGQVLFLSPTTTGVPASQVLGHFLVIYDVYFRNRQ